ncbi:unnamed protein product [Eretmochelys imbricata]
MLKPLSYPSPEAGPQTAPQEMGSDPFIKTQSNICPSSDSNKLLHHIQFSVHSEPWACVCLASTPQVNGVKFMFHHSSPGAEYPYPEVSLLSTPVRPCWTAVLSLEAAPDDPGLMALGYFASCMEAAQMTVTGN